MKTMSNETRTSCSTNSMKMTQRSHVRRILIGAAIAIVGGIGWYLFRPELLFVNKTVNEALPPSTLSMANSAHQPSSTLAMGMFHSGAHETKGTATIHQIADGGRVLRLTGFETSNGPDVHVYLVAASDAMDRDTVKSAGFVDLGSLKGNTTRRASWSMIDCRRLTSESTRRATFVRDTNSLTPPTPWPGS
jgi:hypothetical protein